MIFTRSRNRMLMETGSRVYSRSMGKQLVCFLQLQREHRPYTLAVCSHMSRFILFEFPLQVVFEFNDRRIDA